LPVVTLKLPHDMGLRQSAIKSREPSVHPVKGAETRAPSGFGGAIADTRLGFDDRRRRRIALDLGSQLTDEHP
jgi:hypothetical protein